MRWRPLPFLFAACLLAGSPLHAAESATPFDMAPERGSEPAPAAPPEPIPLPAPAQAPAPPPEPIPLPVPAQAPAPAQPFAAPPAPATAADAADGSVPSPRPTQQVEPQAPRSADVEAVIPAKAAAGLQDRPIIPYSDLVLEGEIDSRTWNVVLTGDQASSPATLTLGYKSAVVVAPEASRLNIFINNHLVLDAPIEASDHLGKITVQVQAGLLQAGPNLFHLQVSQRHRTDCTISSTYELRTEIDSAATALHFQSPTATRLTKIEDLAAVSPDMNGKTHLRIVVPMLSHKILVSPVLRFAQAASILIGMPNQNVSVVEKPDGPETAGMVTAVIGTADDLRKTLRSVPSDADSRPIVTFVDDPVLGPSTLVISGPTAMAVSRAVDAIANLVDRPKGVPRNVLDTSRWSAPNPPLFLGAAHTTLSSLGVPTQEFAGRRFKTDFQIGIPSDFYANASGEATLMLDAAYSATVLPGSHFDIYVNDDIATTTPLSTSGGEILRHLPIRIPMTHFRPGPNRVRLEAQLRTVGDTECTMGPSKGDERFALFDTSEFVMPDFARIAQLPNLAAFQGTGFPYNNSDAPVALVLGDFSPDIVSAAATLLGRMAIAAGRLIVVDPNLPPSAAGDRNAIFLATAAQVSPQVQEQLDLDSRMGSAWNTPEEPPPAQGRAVAANSPSGVSGNALGSAGTISDNALADPTDTQETFDRWRDRLSTGGGWRGDVSSFQDWIQHTFQLSGTSLRFLPSKDVAFVPPHGSSAMIAQGPSLSGDAAWTLLSAPTPRLLRQGVDALTDGPQWFQLSGRVVSYTGKTNAIQIQPVTIFSFIPTRPFSLANLRLIAANWLSENILAFSLLLFAACLLLGLATALFLSRIGRRSSA